MLGIRLRHAILTLGLWTTTSCAPAPDDEGESHVEDSDAPGAQMELEAPLARELAAATTTRVRTLPRGARSVVHEEVNEAENLFFTQDGRLFVSGAEEILEIKRKSDGTFTKTDLFDGQCTVEGVVHHQRHLYGVCWAFQFDLSVRAYLIAGEITETPAFRIIAELEKNVVPNGMTFDPQGRLYVTYTAAAGQIVRFTFGTPLTVARKEVWAASGLPNVNGIKYLDGAMYVTLLNEVLMSQFARIPILPDGSPGKPEILYERWFTVLDDFIPFDGNFILTDFLKGTLVFWNAERGVYAETTSGTFYSPTALARGVAPMFNERQLLVTEKGTLFIRDEKNGDLLSVYKLP